MARIVLGVTGAIAAYKAVHLARLLVEAGHAVRVVPTRASFEFIGAATWQALTTAPAVSDVFNDSARVDHVALGQEADIIIVAPATADIMARAAAGLGNDLLSAVLLASKSPLILAPSMHSEMLSHPSTQANIATLEARGATVLDAPAGRLTGLDTGPGRMMEPEEIFEYVQHLLNPPPQDLAGRRVVVTAGGTREALDPVRFLGNHSSGKQGFAVARAAAERGAEVALVACNCEQRTPAGVRRADVATALELREAVEGLAATADVLIQAAAVADFRPASYVPTKVKRADSPDRVSLELVANPDILAELVSTRRPGQVLVGFAAETGDAQASAFEHARAKAMRKGTDLTVANVVGEGQVFGLDHNDVIIFDAQGAEVRRALGTKAEVATAILDEVGQVLQRA
ncbi:MAG: bifunctional phosphopantothenoylcysteine decarboxylase/phosphopantothenate--cysteine ligase CoaBC [Micrococcales bacterium]|nr:bifunctional phosphopantothenoylcysteine decarboxylase/phosphopantothenate--cysteine ligase CoaBC [Micrococcales bacterium]